MIIVRSGRWRVAGAVLAVTLVLMGGAPCLAQDHPERSTGRIADHRFMESELVPLPLLTTNIATTLGTGQASKIDVEVFENVDSLPVRTVSGSLAYLSFRVAYQQAVNEWLAPWIGLGVAARIGTTSVSLLNEGVSYQYSFEFGWLIRIHEWQRSRLAGTLSLRNSIWGFVDVGEWTRGVIRNGGIGEGNEVYESALSLSGGGGLRYAYAINSMFGTALAIEGGVGEPPDRSGETHGFFRGSVLVDADLSAGGGIPVGLGLGYRYDTFPGVEPVTRWESNMGIIRVEYTGRDDYAVAFETQFGSLPLSSGGTTPVTQFKIGTRYYF